MNFSTFNGTNNYLTPTAFKRANLAQGFSDYLKQSDKAPYYQAYRRTNPAGQDRPENFLQTIWTAALQQHPHNTAAAITSLCTHLNVFWSQTIKPRAKIRLDTERDLRLAYYTTGAGKGTCPTLEDYCQQPIQDQFLGSFAITKALMLEYGNFLSRITAQFAPPTNTLHFHRTYKQAVDLSSAVGALTGTDDVTLGSHKHQNLVACSNFWQTEIPAIQGRKAESDWLEGWAGAAIKSDVLKRLVCDAERDDLETNRRLAQGPGSYERHKWFYFGKGAPGVGHAREIHFTLHGNPIAQLMQKAQDVSDESQKTSTHAFLRKANELDCIGIHEDLLPLFFEKMVKDWKVAK